MKKKLKVAKNPKIKYRIFFMKEIGIFRTFSVLILRDGSLEFESMEN